MDNKIIKQQLKMKKINCNNIESSLKVKNDMLKLLGAGSFGVAFLGCLDKLCEKKVSVKFVSMKKKYKLDNKNTHPAYIEGLVGQELSKLVDNNISPHINYTYFFNLCNKNKISKYKSILNSEWYKKKINIPEYNTKFYDNIMVIFNKYADSDFKDYVINRYEKNNELPFKEHLNNFFCFCYTISCAVNYIPNYRHNDIKPNNFLVQFIDSSKYDNQNYNKYTIFGNDYYLPQLPYILKIHDFDYSYSNSFKNQKITNYFNSQLFKEINATPFTNPVYDLHEYINFYFKDFDKYLKGTKIESYFKSLLPEGTFGQENTYTRRYKLTNYKVNGYKNNLNDKQKSNYIPKNMKTPSELILTDPIFNIFRNKPLKGIMINHYDSKINLTPKTKKRADMFNVYLKK